jgi:CrcB protein
VTRLAWVCLGGALGSGLRYLVASGAVRWLGVGFPYGTLAVNLVGSFAIGLVHGYAMASLALSESARAFLAAGVLGGLTTYSAFSYETVQLAESGAWGRAVLNVGVTTAGSLVLCLLGLAAGRALGGLGGGR